MDITVRNLQSKTPIFFSKFKTTALKACSFLGLSKSELSIVFVGARRMRNINKQYLNHDYITDVITFDLEQTAEIIICPWVAEKNAKAYDLLVQQELVLYLIHGLLHLAGYNDHNLKDIQRIRSKEQQLLSQLT